MSTTVRQPAAERPRSANGLRPRSGRRSQNKSGTKWSPRTLNSNVIPLVGHINDPSLQGQRLPSPIDKVGPAGNYVGGKKTYSTVVPFVGTLPKPLETKAGHAPAMFAGGRRVARRTSQKKKDAPKSPTQPTQAVDPSQPDSEEKHAARRSRDYQEKRHDNNEKLDQKEQLRVMHDHHAENGKAAKNHAPPSKMPIVQPRGNNF